MGGEHGDFVRIQMHRVHGNQLRADQPKALQARQRPFTGFGEFAVDLIGGLVEVDMHRQAQLFRVARDFGKRRVTHRVGRVRGEAK